MIQVSIPKKNLLSEKSSPRMIAEVKTEKRKKSNHLSFAYLVLTKPVTMLEATQHV